MEVSSFLTGKRGVSLPFTDVCPVLSENEGDFDKLFKAAVDFGKTRQWKYIELRPDKQLPGNEKTFATFFTHTLSLDKPEPDLFKNLRSTTRRNINKALKNGIITEISTSWKALKAFYRLNCIGRKYHGLPPQPFRFFENVFRYVISKGKGIIVNGIYDGKVISSNLYLLNRDLAIYKYGANDPAYMHLRSSYLVMWDAIRWLAAKGYNSLGMGRTDEDAAGLLQFKRGWGVEEFKNAYYRYDLTADRFIASQSGMKTTYTIFRRMPVPILQLIGKALYRHVA